MSGQSSDDPHSCYLLKNPRTAWPARTRQPPLIQSDEITQQINQIQKNKLPRDINQNPTRTNSFIWISTKVNEVCSDPRLVLHPGLVEICWVVLTNRSIDQSAGEERDGDETSEYVYFSWFYLLNVWLGSSQISYLAFKSLNFQLLLFEMSIFVTFWIFNVTWTFYFTFSSRWLDEVLI